MLEVYYDQDMVSIDCFCGMIAMDLSHPSVGAELAPRLSPASGGSLIVFGVPWFVGTPS